MNMLANGVNKQEASKESDKPGSGLNVTYGDSGDFDINDLIPEELKVAAGLEEESVNKQDSDINADDKVKHVSNSIENENEDPSDNINLPETDEDLEKLLNGDFSVDKSTSEDNEEDEFFWKEDEGYKDILSRTQFSGVTSETLNNVIKNAVDKKVIDTGKFTEGLQTKLTESEKEKEYLLSEVNRLKELEKIVHFENSDVVKEKYLDPMKVYSTNIKDVIEYEGIPNLAVRDLLAAKDRIAFNSLLDGYQLEDASRTKLVNSWRNYRELQLAMEADRADAKVNLGKHLSTKVEKSTVDKILTNVLTDLTEKEGELEYVKKGLMEGWEKHEDAREVVGKSSANFRAILSALENPADSIRNVKLMNSLAQYCLWSEHNSKQAGRVNDILSENTKLKTQFKKVVSAYKDLASSGKGISGNPGKGVSVNSTKQDNTSEEDVAKEYAKVLSGEISIDDILGLN